MATHHLPYDLLVILDALRFYGINNPSTSFVIDLREIFLPEETYDARILDDKTLMKNVNPHSKKSMDDISTLKGYKFIKAEYDGKKYGLSLNSDHDQLVKSLKLDEKYRSLSEKVKKYIQYCWKNRYNPISYANEISKEFYKHGMYAYNFEIQKDPWSQFIVKTLEKVTDVPFVSLKEIYNQKEIYRNIRHPKINESYDDYILRIYFENATLNRKVMINGKCSLINRSGKKIVLTICGNTRAIAYLYEPNFAYDEDFLRNQTVSIIGIPHIDNGVPVVIALQAIIRNPIRIPRFNSLKYS